MRFHLAWMKGECGLTAGCKGCVRSEENILGCCVKNSEKDLLGGVKSTDATECE